MYFSKEPGNPARANSDGAHRRVRLRLILGGFTEVSNFRFGCADENRKLQMKGFGQIHERSQGGTLFAPLDLADIADIVAKFLGELLLAPTALGALARQFGAQSLGQGRRFSFFVSSDRFGHTAMVSQECRFYLMTIVVYTRCGIAAGGAAVAISGRKQSTTPPPHVQSGSESRKNRSRRTDGKPSKDTATTAIRAHPRA